MPLVACPACDASVSSQADACVKCGHPLDFRSCPTCEHVVHGDSTFCPGCGQPLAGAVPAGAHAYETHSPFGWYTAVWGRFADFSGRARRKEYWWFAVLNAIVVFCLVVLDGMLATLSIEAGIGFLSGLYVLAGIIPGLALAVRRLHDTGRTGWWVLLGFVPFFGLVVLFVFAVLDTEPRTNAYGPPPKPFWGWSS